MHTTLSKCYCNANHSLPYKLLNFVAAAWLSW